MHKKVARRIKINPQYWKQWKLKQTLYFKKKYFSNGYITHFLLYNMFPEFLINWFCINTGITFVKSCVHQASMVRICFSNTWSGVISWPGDCSLFNLWSFFYLEHGSNQDSICLVRPSVEQIMSVFQRCE